MIVPCTIPAPKPALKRALPGPMGHLGDTSPFSEVSGRIFGPKALLQRDLRGYPVAFESSRE